MPAHLCRFHIEQRISLWIKARGLGKGWTRPACRALGRPSPRAAAGSKLDIGIASLCVASPRQANSHACDASYDGEQGYNCFLSQYLAHLSFGMTTIKVFRQVLDSCTAEMNYQCSLFIDRFSASHIFDLSISLRHEDSHIYYLYQCFKVFQALIYHLLV